jgi:hypothetical protein
MMADTPVKRRAGRTLSFGTCTPRRRADNGTWMNGQRVAEAVRGRFEPSARNPYIRRKKAKPIDWLDAL